MAKRAFNFVTIVNKAAAYVEEKGLDNITLYKLADILNVKIVSLYNHLDSLPESNKCLAELVLTRLGCRS